MRSAGVRRPSHGGSNTRPILFRLGPGTATSARPVRCRGRRISESPTVRFWGAVIKDGPAKCPGGQGDVPVDGDCQPELDGLWWIA